VGPDAQAVEKIFVAKGRPHSDPLILHVSEPGMVRDLVRELPPAAEALMARFWPGPLTLVLPKSARVPDSVTAGMDSVAVRMPAHPVALALITAAGVPLAAPSANLFGHTSPTTAEHVLQDLDGRIDAVLDGGATHVGVESTVLDVRGDTPVILRPGGVTRDELEAALGVPIAARGEASPEGMRSPGLLTRHYSPRAEVRLFSGPPEAVAAEVRRQLDSGEAPQPAAVLAYREDLDLYEGLPARVADLGSAAAPADVARSLYAAFRRLDREGARCLFVRLAPPGGLGDAVNDRLLRAASGRLTRVQ
jgi:L-threonylcarbamoyladenylate synthase